MARETTDDWLIRTGTLVTLVNWTRGERLSGCLSEHEATHVNGPGELHRLTPALAAASGSSFLSAGAAARFLAKARAKDGHRCSRSRTVLTESDGCIFPSDRKSLLQSRDHSTAERSGSATAADSDARRSH